jgi:sugar lactone lactonase YvrE
MEFRAIATGYCFLEAPRADGDAVWFSDPVLGGLRRIWPDGRVDEFVPDRKRIGGAAINEDGAIVFGGMSGLAWLDPSTRRAGMLLDAIDGRPIPAVNDIFPDGKGGLYFGTSHAVPQKPDEPPQTTALHRLDTDGHITLLWDGLRVANGIGLSPDGRRLYLNESWLGTFAYDVTVDGNLSNRTLFSAQQDCDGLAVDREGGVWVACFLSGMIIRVLPNGKPDRRVQIPAKNVTSLCFGGAEWRDLYVTTGGDEGLDALMKGSPPPRTASLYHGRAEVPGLATPVARFCLPRDSRPSRAAPPC